MRWLWRILGGLVLLLILAVGAAYFWLRASLPEYEGTVRLAGLTGPVTIVQDEQAVPHIFAGSEDDAYFALGYLHARDRLWQMDLQRRVGQGRLSELRFFEGFGLEVDRYMRTLGLYRRAQAEAEAAPAEVRQALAAYTAGVNAWLTTHDGPLPGEFAILGYEPEPWAPADSIVWGKLMAVQLSGNSQTELIRPRVAALLGEERLHELLPSGLAGSPVTIAGLPTLGPSTASNEWVVAGSLTATAKPLLANDPHLTLAAPIMWYLARIETPTLSLAGATVPGVPFHILGHNGTIAWGLTTTGGDVQDLFIERVDPADPTRYLTPGGSETFLIRQETIQPRGGEPETLTVRETRHGPVISDISPEAAAAAGDGQVMALAFTAIAAEDQSGTAFYRLNRARNWDEFRAALALVAAPQQNVVYADTAGNIGLYMMGRIPLRPGDGLAPVPGWTGDNDWAGYAPADGQPQLYNPDNGRIVNANNAVVGPDFPYPLGFDFEDGYRALRIDEVLAEPPAPLTADMMSALQVDTLSAAARDLAPLMLAIEGVDERVQAALALLRAWDFRMERDRSEPLIFETWLIALNRALYADELGEELFPELWGLRATAVKGMLTTATRWCDDTTTEGTEDCAAVLALSLDEALGQLEAAFGEDMTEWRWGTAHIAPLEHQVFGRIPLIGGWFGNAIATSGDNYTVNRGNGRLPTNGASYAHTHGAGYRAVYDLADLAASHFVIATGQSGHPLSPHFGDQVERWRDGGHITLAGDRAALEARGLAVLTLEPAP